MNKENFFWKRMLANTPTLSIGFWGVQLMMENWEVFLSWWGWTAWAVMIISFTYFLDMDVGIVGKRCNK